MNGRYLVYTFIFLLLSVNAISKAQSSPVIYFCERYSADSGEVHISDRFTKGPITVMVKSNNKISLKNVHIQFDKWDPDSLSFNFYKRFNFTIKPDMKYVFFSKNDESDMSLDEPGFYRVFLLTDSDKKIASGLVQIIE
jgi:hypothetical protein